MAKSDLVQPLWSIISLLPIKNFDEDPEEKTLIACTYCVNNGIVLETLPPSHLLLSQPCMQALFHLPLLSSSVACDCWDHQPAPAPLAGSGAIRPSRLDGAQRSLSLTHTAPEPRSVFTLHGCNKLDDSEGRMTGKLWCLIQRLCSGVDLVFYSFEDSRFFDHSCECRTRQPIRVKSMCGCCLSHICLKLACLKHL